MITTPDNDNNFDGPMIFIIHRQGLRSPDASEGIDLHIMLKAPDDDTAVREALNALAEEGFIEADLDEIGMLTARSRLTSHTHSHWAPSKAKSRLSEYQTEGKPPLTLSRQHEPEAGALITHLIRATKY